MSATENLSTPFEIDTHLAELHDQAHSLEQSLAAAVSTIMVQSGPRRQYRGRDLVWLISFEEAVATVERQTIEHINDYMGRRAAEALAKHEAAVEAFDAKLAECREVEKLYTGWSRFFVVTSSNGHIHRSRACTTCYHTTTFGWLPQLSGKTETDAVEVCGPALCSVCFPTAPVAQQSTSLSPTQVAAILAGEPYESAEAKRERTAAERQAKADAKLVKAAQRATKLLAKVEQAVTDLGGWEVIDAMPEHGTGGLYEAINGFGAFAARKPLQATVGAELSAQADERRGTPRPSYHTDPRQVITRAQVKGFWA